MPAPDLDHYQSRYVLLFRAVDLYQKLGAQRKEMAAPNHASNAWWKQSEPKPQYKSGTIPPRPPISNVHYCPTRRTGSHIALVSLFASLEGRHCQRHEDCRVNRRSQSDVKNKVRPRVSYLFVCVDQSSGCRPSRPPHISYVFRSPVLTPQCAEVAGTRLPPRNVQEQQCKAKSQPRKKLLPLLKPTPNGQRQRQPRTTWRS
jgi:hypothetical protein